MLQQMLSHLLDLFLGQHCFGCRESGTLLCDSCAQKLPPAPLGNDEARPFIACLAYRDERVRKALQALKFRKAKVLAIPLGNILHERLLEELGDALLFSGVFLTPGVEEDPPADGSGSTPGVWKNSSSKLLIVPIPLHKKRQRQRGYNQVTLLAEAMIAAASDHTMELGESILEKVHETKSQVQCKGRDERLSNLRGAFAVRDTGKVLGRHIILLDDIVTTGTTLTEAKATLMQAGAASVTCLALAH